jgi:hypothetical protein
MPRCVIERDPLGLGSMPQRAQISTAMRTKRVLHELGPDLHWSHSY